MKFAVFAPDGAMSRRDTEVSPDTPVDPACRDLREFKVAMSEFA